MSETKTDYTFVDYLYMLVKHRWLIIINGFIFCAIAAVYSLLMPKTYTSHVTIMPPESGGTSGMITRTASTSLLIPGFTYSDYTSMAVGELPSGDATRYVLTDNAYNSKSQGSSIESGDHIDVPKSRKYILIGEFSVLQVIMSVRSSVPAFIAATIDN